MAITRFVWDTVSDCVLSELDGSNNVTAVYTNEPQRYGGVVSQRRGTTSHFHHHDALGSTRFLTDSSGNVTDTYLNDAWGNSVASTGTTVNPYRWVGKYGYYTDNSTGQVYVRARMYQPTVARWASVDPLYYYHTRAFVYCYNTPSLSTDESGLDALNITMNSSSCHLCGEAELVWKHRTANSGVSATGKGRTRPPALQEVVQRICLILDYKKCKAEPDQVEGGEVIAEGCCKEVGSVTASCCFFEHLGSVRSNWFEPGSSITDTWRTPNYGTKRCTTAGMWLIFATVRTFDAADREIQRDLAKWSHINPCPGFPATFDTNNVSREAPSWFDTKEVDEGFNALLLVWNCCDDTTQTMWYSFISDGVVSSGQDNCE